MKSLIYIAFDMMFLALVAWAVITWPTTYLEADEELQCPAPTAQHAPLAYSSHQPHPRRLCPPDSWLF